MDRPVAQRPGEEPAGVALAPQPGNHGVFFQEAVVRSSRAPSEQLCLPPAPTSPLTQPSRDRNAPVPLGPKNGPVLPGPLPPRGIYSALAGCRAGTG